MKRLVISCALVIVGLSFIYAQPRTTITSGATLPANCTADANIYGKTGTDSGFYFCTATNTWSFASFRSGGDSSLSNPNYTASNSGLIIYDVNGVEVWRLWAGDPDPTDANNSDWNLYLGAGAGAAQLTDNTGGFHNTGIGRHALFSSTTGAKNTAIGSQALEALTTGRGNVAIGADGPLQSLTTGSGNIAIGVLALNSNTTGSNNIAIGLQALQTMPSGDNNVAVGESALKIASGGNNVAVGTETEIAVTTGHDNTGIGANTLSALTTGIQNVAVGHLSGQNITTGNQNVSLGNESGVTTGSLDNSIAVGHGVSVSASNRGVIGNASVTDVYFGSETAAANVLFATALPTVGYKSTDGSPGITSATCTAWKNGLCVTP